MPLDKYVMYMNEAYELELTRRRGYVMDTLGAIGGAFSEDGITEYLNGVLSGDD